MSRREQYKKTTGIDIDRCFFNIANQIRIIENSEKIKDYVIFLESIDYHYEPFTKEEKEAQNFFRRFNENNNSET